MKARGELRLVRDFAELRAGMVVVAKACPMCDGAHRMMLVRLGGFGDWPGDPTWRTVPEVVHFGRIGVISRRSVDKRVIFRVVDGLEDERPTTTATPRPMERVR